MYLRTTARRNQDGTLVRYLALVHNRRVDGSTQAQVLLNLGREPAQPARAAPAGPLDQPLPRRARHLWGQRRRRGPRLRRQGRAAADRLPPGRHGLATRWAV